MIQYNTSQPKGFVFIQQPKLTINIKPRVNNLTLFYNIRLLFRVYKISQN